MYVHMGRGTSIQLLNYVYRLSGIFLCSCRHISAYKFTAFCLNGAQCIVLRFMYWLQITLFALKLLITAAVPKKIFLCHDYNRIVSGFVCRIV